MSNYHSRRTRRKSAFGWPDGQDLFSWAANRIAADPPAPPTQRAVRHVARCLRLSPHIARLVAEHAGFNLEASE
jgi:hypothetical protein